MEDNPRWKTTFGGRQSLVEDNLQYKMTFVGRQPSVEDNLWWKTLFGGRQPSVEDDLQWKTAIGGSLHAAFSALRHFLKHHLKSLSLNLLVNGVLIKKN